MSSPSAPALRHRMDPPIRQEWLAQWQEEIIEPELPIVDPHHHLWDVPDWDTRYLLDELLADLNTGHTITATVFLQCWSMHRAGGPEAMQPVGETEFVNGIAAMSASGNYGPTRVCAGIVGFADLLLGAHVQEVLEAHIQAAGGPGGRFKGIRHAVAWDAEVGASAQVQPGLLGDPTFREGFSRLAPLGLSFDAWLYHPQLDELTALARAYPDTPIVLNHIGAPLGVGPYAGRRDEVFQTWAQSIRELATCQNVHVKLGGMGMGRYGNGFHELPRPPSSEALAAACQPYVDTCVEAFGSARCMFESNFPVDKGAYPYAAYWNACKRLAQGASASVKADLFRDTATRFYRL
ncbi:MAG: amidohydrolase [Chloroflexi bacterium]|nr:amidohydrolase [Chloroflexota bacterium]